MRSLHNNDSLYYVQAAFVPRHDVRLLPREVTTYTSGGR